MIDAADFPSLPALIASLTSLWSPPERLPLSTWSEQNIVLSSEYAASSTILTLFGWQRAMFDSFTDPTVTELILFVAVQMVKTLLIQCATAYVVCMDPGPILLTEPKDDDAKAFTRERLAPMIRDCDCLHGLIPEAGHDGNLLQTKEFPGGSLSLVGVNSPGNLARRTIRYLFCDEIDKYPKTVGSVDNKEGDPLSLAEARQTNFRSRKKRIKACSPTTAGQSRIARAYKASDQRKPWARCWQCGTAQILKWDQVKWNSAVSVELQPATAYYLCRNLECNAHWNDTQRWAAADAAEWRAERPFAGIAGYWISHLYSPWKTLAEMVAHFLRAKDDRTELQAFVNTVLAEEWQDEGETPDADVLYGRREPYAFQDDADAVVPQRGLFLTAAVDVQENPPRLEVETCAWGRGRERWSLDYRVIQVFSENGQPLPVTSPELWDELDRQVLQRNWPHESGHTLPIMCMGIDTGRRPKPVYEFARKHPQLAYGPAGVRLHAVRTVVPIKGTHGPNSQLRILDSVSKEDAARQRQGVRIVGIGTHCAKQEIYDLLQHVRHKPDGTLSGASVAGCCHFPEYDLGYFESVCSEIRRVDEDGDVKYEQIRKRNEGLDCMVYNRGMAAVVGIDRFGESQWQQLELAVRPIGQTATATQTPAANQPTPPRTATPSSASPYAPAVPPAATQPAAVASVPPPRRSVRGSF